GPACDAFDRRVPCPPVETTVTHRPADGTAVVVDFTAKDVSASSCVVFRLHLAHPLVQPCFETVCFPVADDVSRNPEGIRSSSRDTASSNAGDSIAGIPHQLHREVVERIGAAMRIGEERRWASDHLLQQRAAARDFVPLFLGGPAGKEAMGGGGWSDIRG